MSEKLSGDAGAQARFFARELIARIERESGEMPPMIRDRMMFAAEMGYMRGHGDGMVALATLHDDLRKKVIDGNK